MEKIDLANELKELQTVNSTDVVMGYSKTGKKWGFIPLSFVTNEGYACRRWKIDGSSPVGEAVGNLDYLRALPGLLGLGCYLVDRNHGRRKLDPTDHYKFATGEAAKLDGTMGDYMWGWNTAWYYAWWIEGSYYYEAASLKPIKGRLNYRIPVGSTAAIGVSVVDRTNLELVSVVSEAAQYRGGNNDATKDGTFRTLLGRAATSMTAETFGQYARKKGDGWEAFWYAHNAATGILFRIIFGNRNVQATVNANKDANGLWQGGLGPGVTGASSWWSAAVAENANSFGTYPFLPTSLGVELGDGCGVSNYAVKGASGETLYTAPVPVFFGLKNFYGYMNRLERGILINKIAGGAGDVYVVPKLYSAYSMSSLSGLTKVATIPAAQTASTWEYIERVSMQNLCHKPTVSGGGTSSTYYADGFYNDNTVSGLRVPVCGGNADSGSTAGLESLNASYGVSASSASYGSPLCESEENWDTTPFLAAE